MAELKALLGDKYKEGMTVEELLSMDIEEPKSDSSEYDKLKRRIDELTKETSDYKKQLRAKQTDDERKAAEIAETIETLKRENSELKQKDTISQTTKELMAIGYDEKTATETAQSLYEGDVTAVIKSQAAFVEAQKKAVIADAVKNMPTPPAGNGNGDGAANYEKLIEQAQERHDYSAVAYYTRLSEQEKQNNNQ